MKEGNCESNVMWPAQPSLSEECSRLTSRRLGTIRRFDLILFQKVGILPFVALTALHREIRKSGLAELLHWLVAPTSRDPARSKVTGTREPRRRRDAGAPHIGDGLASVQPTSSIRQQCYQRSCRLSPPKYNTISKARLVGREHQMVSTQRCREFVRQRKQERPRGRSLNHLYTPG